MSGPEDHIRLTMDIEQAEAVEAALGAVLAKVDRSHPGHEPLTRAHMSVSLALALKRRRAERERRSDLFGAVPET